MSRSIDYSALLNPVSPRDVTDFKVRSRASGAAWAQANVAATVGGIVVGVVVASLLLMCASFIGGFVLSIAQSNPNPVSIGFTAFVGFFILCVVAVIGTVVVRSQFGPGKWQKWFKATKFAEANGLVFSPIDRYPHYPGMVFQEGHDRVVLDHYRTEAGRFIDIGTVRYQTGSGKSETTHSFGFLALSLDRALPNMVLDAKSNNSLFGTNLPAEFSRDQVLHLEGDFDTRFTLYCPTQYETDALYVFTPDLMALLIDEAAPFDVEIVDSWMFVYSTSAINPTDPAILQRLFRIIETVGAKAVSQTHRYADERIGDPAVNLVAPQGQRLRRRVSVVAIVFIVVWLAVWLIPKFAGW